MDSQKDKSFLPTIGKVLPTLTGNIFAEFIFVILPLNRENKFREMNHLWVDRENKCREI